jgi:hypothetical protein
MRRLMAVAVLLCALSVAHPMDAQRRGGGSNSQSSRAEMERRLRESYERLVRERLGLTEGQARELSEAVLVFQEERVDLQRRETTLRRRLEGQGGGGQANRRLVSLPEDQARDILREMRSIQDAETDLFNREQDRLMQLLTPQQLVTYYQIREDLGDALRRVRGPGHS